MRHCSHWVNITWEGAAGFQEHALVFLALTSPDTGLTLFGTGAAVGRLGGVRLPFARCGHAPSPDAPFALTRLIASLATRGAWKGKFVNFSSGAQHLPSTPSRAALSWSGGKDACLAWLRAQDMGLNVSTFVTMCGGGGGRSLSHSLPRSWLAQQVAACGVTWLAVDVPSGRPNAYASAFDHTLATLRSQGHTHMVFGDIDLAAHRDWIEPRCTAAGLIAVFPLWQEPRPLLAQEIIQRGIQARLVAVDLARLDASFCGARYDQSLLDSLPDHVCPCGEEGEFHTAVTWAPGMRTTVPLCVTGVQTHAGTPTYAPAGLAHLQITDMPALP